MYGVYHAKWSDELVPVHSTGVRCVELVIFDNAPLVVLNIGTTGIDLGTYVVNLVCFS